MAKWYITQNIKLNTQNLKCYLCAKAIFMRNILILLLIFGLVSCNSENKEVKKQVIAVSIIPQQYLVSSIADTLVEVVVMVPPGASPATWEATAEQMKDLSDASIYFRIGHIGFEKAWMEQISSLNENMRIIDLSEGMNLVGLETRHGDHTHTGVDPHIWMSPIKMEQMARKVFNELKVMFPEDKEYLRANYEDMMKDIKSSANHVKGSLQASEGRSFMIFHPSLGYLASDYGLEQVSIEFEGKEPSPSYLKECIDLAKQKGIKVIFVQKEFDRRNAELIASEIGGEVIVIDPLSYNWPAEMKSIAEQLRKALR